jgi:hypothetical protein
MQHGKSLCSFAFSRSLVSALAGTPNFGFSKVGLSILFSASWTLLKIFTHYRQNRRFSDNGKI